MFETRYADVYKGDAHWQAIKVEASDTYRWNPGSTYVASPPFFEGMEMTPKPVQDITEAKPLVSRLGRRDAVFEPSFRWEQLIELALSADEYRLLTAVDGHKTLYDLCSLEPLSAANNAKLLYAFLVLQLVRRVGSAAESSTGRVKVQLETAGDEFSV